MNHFDTKLKNLKKMYNQLVKSDYNDGQNKTSIRNKKNRILHVVTMGQTAINFDTKRVSYASRTNGNFSDKQQLSLIKSGKNQPKKKQLVINDAY